MNSRVRERVDPRLRHESRGGSVSRAGSDSRPPALRAVSVGGLALGAVALGAFAIGAMAIGRLAIGRARIKRLEIDELIVRRLRVIEEVEVPEKADHSEIQYWE
jgi:hypothetical protein